ncbi:MAG: MJ1255/VC2487 family glycosyltransferase [Cellvibrionaceae bacterium]
MKILYGVQATGNGHITRARAMHKALKKKNLHVDYLFSGRAREDFFDMEEFGNFACHSGLTFITEAGSIKPFATFQKNNFKQLLCDIKNLDLSVYDLVLTDFEPISAWAARRQKKPSVAVGHQYAFDHDIPKKGNNPITALFMQYFAPAETRLGLHWHHFGQAILPPIADTHAHQSNIIENKVVVYLGFEKSEEVIAYLKPYKDYQFFIYGHYDQKEDRENLQLRPLSRDGFQQDLANCNGVITNAGFELASEAIHLGKKLLVKPLHGQMEQLSNALALEKLKLGISMNKLDKQKLEDWLRSFTGKRVIYPSVPDALAEWIVKGDFKQTNHLIEQLWENVSSPDIPNFTSKTI